MHTLQEGSNIVCVGVLRLYYFTRAPRTLDKQQQFLNK